VAFRPAVWYNGNGNMCSDIDQQDGGIPLSGRTYTFMDTRRTLNRVRAPSMPFERSLNPYRGCAHGCSFCYARAFHPYLGLGANDEFQNRILIKRNAPEALEAELRAAVRRYGGRSAAIRNIGEVAVGTATDPYQPVEAQARITRECLKILARYGVPVTITTRSPLILRDLDILKEMNLLAVNISVNTMDHRLMRLLEPASPHPAKRMEAVAALNDAGVPAGIFLAPILPFLTDTAETLEEICAAAKGSRAEFVMPSLLRLAPDVRAWYLSVLARHFPRLVGRYAALYRGAYPDPGEAGRILERARLIIARHGLNERPGSRNPSGSTAEPEAEQICFPFGQP